jgi:Domain of unknown function (DUF4832)/Domain of unknown function (DUF4874)
MQISIASMHRAAARCARARNQLSQGHIITGAAALALMLSACGGSSSSSSERGKQPSDADAQTISVTLSATDEAIANPERGFYGRASDDLVRITRGDADAAFTDGKRLIFTLVRLDAYKDAALPDNYLAQIRAGLGIVRSAGLKTVLRFVYNYPENETDFQNVQDASLTRVLAHIEQLAPALQDNADVISVLQGGFIGAWGEWHTSSNGLTEASARTQVRDALLAAMPTEKFIQLRYPGHVMAWYPTATALSQAFSGSGQARIGLHNDCFLASATDVGTYSEDAATRALERDYVAAVSQSAPFGGETCNPADEPGAQVRGSCADILAEGRQFSLTYLNNDYYREAFHDRWQSEGCLPEVERRMGYRLAWGTITHAVQAQRGQSLTVDFSVRNEGWARPYSARPMQIVLRHRTSGDVLRLAGSGVDVRNWLPDATHTGSLVVAVPETTAAGDYDVHVALPDGAATLTADVRYAIRPANADSSATGAGWDATLGAFRLGSVLTVL